MIRYATLLLTIPIFMLSATMPAARAADCPAPAGGLAVSQQQSLADGTLARSIGGAASPYLELLDASCHDVFRLGTTAPGRGAVADGPQVALRFLPLQVDGLPQPLLAVSIAAPGGSDTSFDTQLIAPLHRRWQPLLARPLQSLLEGGVYVGPLGGRLGTGVALWNFVWASSEAHVSPHRYTLRRLRWSGGRFVPLPTLTTRGKYSDPAAALREWKVDYADLTRGMPDFDKFR